MVESTTTVQIPQSTTQVALPGMYPPQQTINQQLQIALSQPQRTPVGPLTGQIAQYVPQNIMPTEIIAGPGAAPNLIAQAAPQTYGMPDGSYATDANYPTPAQLAGPAAPAAYGQADPATLRGMMPMQGNYVPPFQGSARLRQIRDNYDQERQRNLNQLMMPAPGGPPAAMYQNVPVPYGGGIKAMGKALLHNAMNPATWNPNIARNYAPMYAAQMRNHQAQMKEYYDQQEAARQRLMSGVNAAYSPEASLARAEYEAQVKAMQEKHATPQQITAAADVIRSTPPGPEQDQLIADKSIELGYDFGYLRGQYSSEAQTKRAGDTLTNMGKYLDNTLKAGTVEDKIAQSHTKTAAAKARLDILQETKQQQIDYKKGQAEIEGYNAKIKQAEAANAPEYEKNKLRNQKIEAEKAQMSILQAAAANANKLVGRYNQKSIMLDNDPRVTGAKAKDRAAVKQGILSAEFGPVNPQSGLPDTIHNSLEVMKHGFPEQAQNILDNIRSVTGASVSMPQESAPVQQKAQSAPAVQRSIIPPPPPTMPSMMVQPAQSPQMQKANAWYNSKRQQIESQLQGDAKQSKLKELDAFFQNKYGVTPLNMGQDVQVSGSTAGAMASGQMAGPLKPPKPEIPLSAYFLAGTPGPDGLAASELLRRNGIDPDKIPYDPKLAKEAFGE